MSNLQFSDIFLLECSFAVRTAEAPRDPAASSDPLRLTTSQDRSDGRPFLLIRGEIDDPALPFRMSMTMIAWFELDATQLDSMETRLLERTMTFMAFPYVREFVSDLTDRSPGRAFFLPPRSAAPAS